MGWRDQRQRREEETIPPDVLQQRGKEIEANVGSLRAKLLELPPSRQDSVRKEIEKLERECAALTVKLLKGGTKPLFGCGQIKRRPAASGKLW